VFPTSYVSSGLKLHQLQNPETSVPSVAETMQKIEHVFPCPPGVIPKPPTHGKGTVSLWHVVQGIRVSW